MVTLTLQVSNITGNTIIINRNNSELTKLCEFNYHRNITNLVFVHFEIF